MTIVQFTCSFDSWCFLDTNSFITSSCLCRIETFTLVCMVNEQNNDSVYILTQIGNIFLHISLCLQKTTCYVLVKVANDSKEDCCRVGYFLFAKFFFGSFLRSVIGEYSKRQIHFNHLQIALRK